MKREPEFFVWVAAAAIVPLMVWAGGAATPLADRAALAASALATWPLAALAAMAMVNLLPARIRGPVAAVALLASVLLIWQMPAVSAEAGRLLEANRAGWPFRFAWRAFFSLSIEFVWLVGVFAVSGARPVPRPAALAWTAAAVAAIVAPLAHSGYNATRRMDRAAEHLAAGRLVLARRELVSLAQSGVWRQFRGVHVSLAIAELDREIARLERACAEPQPRDAGPRERIDQARRLAQLDRTAAALAVLDPVRFASADASMLAGAILQQRGAYSASDAAYHRALELLPGDPAPRTEQAARVERACQALAFNARAEGRFSAVPRIYEQARADWPELAAACDEQLARHYHARGQPALARRHFEAAAAADPARFGGWSRRVGATLDFHGLLTLCSLGGTDGADSQVGSMKSVAEDRP